MIYYKPHNESDYTWFTYVANQLPENRSDGNNPIKIYATKYAVYMKRANYIHWITNDYGFIISYSIEDVRFKNKREKRKRDII